MATAQMLDLDAFGDFEQSMEEPQFALAPVQYEWRGGRLRALAVRDNRLAMAVQPSAALGDQSPARLQLLRIDLAQPQRVEGTP